MLEGLKLLEFSASGSELTEYHVEAAIASVHATASRAEDTARNPMERRFLDQRVAACEGGDAQQTEILQAARANITGTSPDQATSGEFPHLHFFDPTR